MSTRGFIGFVADGKTAIAYNHCDSYPDWLGTNVLGWLRSCDPAEAKARAAALRVVAGDSEPTDADVEALRKYYNPNVGGRSERPTWYQLLRETQGQPGAMLDAGVIEDASNFPYDSLFAEWGYVADFDGGKFEVYRGFQHEVHAEGRFARPEPDDGYYPVKLIQSWPLAALPTDEAFLAALADDE
jgi:hypothetical protein